MKKIWDINKIENLEYVIQSSIEDWLNYASEHGKVANQIVEEPDSFSFEDSALDILSYASSCGSSIGEAHKLAHELEMCKIALRHYNNK